MAQNVFTLQRWNEYSQKGMNASFCIKNAALTPTVISQEETSVVLIVNEKRHVLCTLKPYEAENRLLNFRLERGDSVVMFLEGENDVDLLVEEEDTSVPL